MKRLVFGIIGLIYLLAARLQTKLYSFEDFRIDFPGESVLSKTDGKLTVWSYTDETGGYFFGVAKRSTSANLATLKAWRLGMQREAAASANATPHVREETVQGSRLPGDPEYFPDALTRKTDGLRRACGYALPTLYVVVFYDFNQDRDPEDPESFRKLFNVLNSFEINAAYDRAPQRGR